MPSTVRFSVSDHVGTMTLDRPEAMNAINSQMARDLVEICELIAADPEIWVVVMAAEGDRAFSVGADLKERRDMGVAEWRVQRNTLLRAFRGLSAVERPMIAAVDGYALGGGCELALVCDFIIAGERAQFALPEAKVGIIPGGGGTQLLPRRVGPAIAKEMMFTGRRIDAAEAFRIGLANRVVPSESLDATVDGIVQEILGVSPVSARQVKRAVDAGADQDLRAGWALEEEAYVTCLYSEDRLEGMAAFHEKRTPRFRNQ